MSALRNAVYTRVLKVSDVILIDSRWPVQQCEDAAPATRDCPGQHRVSSDDRAHDR